MHNLRQAIPIVAAGILQPPVSVPRCPSCGVHVHATESTDDGVCVKCAGTVQRPDGDEIDAAFVAARETVARLEAERDARELVLVPVTSKDWSPAQHARAV